MMETLLNTRSLDVIRHDLSYICENLATEFRRMEGGHLLVTGGGGFLGYYLIKSVVSWNKFHAKYQPIVLTVFDNFIRGAAPWLTEMQTNDDINVVQCDVSKHTIDESTRFDFIIHAASIASPTFYRLYPIETMDINVNGIRKIL